MKIGLPKFTFGSKKPEEPQTPVDQNKVLHSPGNIVQRMGSGEISGPDIEYVAQNLDAMIADTDLQDLWSNVHIGMPFSKYRSDLKSVAQEHKRTHPNFGSEPYWLEGKKILVVPGQSGVEVYQAPFKIKDEGTPEETVKLEKQSPWLVFPAGTGKREVLQLLANQRNEDKQIAKSQKIREVLKGA